MPTLTKYGFKKVLQPFINDANKLSEVTRYKNCLIKLITYFARKGIVMSLHGQQKLVKGAVLFALADTLAAHALGGFKVGVGFALRICRICMATREQASTKVQMFHNNTIIILVFHNYFIHSLDQVIFFFGLLKLMTITACYVKMVH